MYVKIHRALPVLRRGKDYAVAKKPAQIVFVKAKPVSQYAEDESKGAD